MLIKIDNPLAFFRLDYSGMHYLIKGNQFTNKLNLSYRQLKIINNTLSILGNVCFNILAFNKAFSLPVFWINNSLNLAAQIRYDTEKQDEKLVFKPTIINIIRLFNLIIAPVNYRAALIADYSLRIYQNSRYFNKCFNKSKEASEDNYELKKKNKHECVKAALHGAIHTLQLVTLLAPSSQLYTISLVMEIALSLKAYSLHKINLTTFKQKKFELQNANSIIRSTLLILQLHKHLQRS